MPNKVKISVPEKSLKKKGLNICVFCSANELEEKYTLPARQLITAVTKQGHGLVYGGSDRGLMKVIADSATEAGGRVIGVSVEYLKDKARSGTDEMIFAKTLGERKALMIERSDVILVLVGGVGTLDEVTEVLELKKHGHHNKPVFILNTQGFYDGLAMQLHKMQETGFLTHPVDFYMTFCKTPSEVIKLIEKLEV